MAREDILQRRTEVKILKMTVSKTATGTSRSLSMLLDCTTNCSVQKVSHFASLQHASLLHEEEITEGGYLIS